jgi:hypothetical protein
VGSSPWTLRRRHGVQLHGRAVDAGDATVRFADGGALEVGTVIWATGFRTDHAWIDVPVPDNRTPGPPARCHRLAGPVLAQADLATHPGLCTPWAG